MTEKKRILFVDDEPAILDALENVLHKERNRWDMVFARSGPAARTAILARPFDIVVADMRMPEVDGAALLDLVKDTSPATVRILLSGHANSEAIARALPVLHQLVRKPCDGRTLRHILERSLYDRDAELDARAGRLIGCIDKLPTPPDIYFDLSELLQSPTSSISEFVAVVARDPALAAKLLQLVNSSFFTKGQPTTSIHHAVSRIGTEQLRYLALTASVFSAAPPRRPCWFTLQDLQRSSMRAACVARALAEPATRDEAFAAALLHDIGHIVLALGRGPELEDFHSRVVREPQAHLELERTMLGVSHSEIGARLLAIWGLPMTIVDIVRFHHDPGSAPESTRRLAAIVHFADAIAHHPPAAVKLDTDSLGRAGCAELVPSWLGIAEQTLRNA